jgi:hypothetical protein
MLGIPLNVLLFLLLMVMGWGSWSGFFAHPVRVGVAGGAALFIGDGKGITVIFSSYSRKTPAGNPARACDYAASLW